MRFVVRSDLSILILEVFQDSLGPILIRAKWAFRETPRNSDFVLQSVIQKPNDFAIKLLSKYCILLSDPYLSILEVFQGSLGPILICAKWAFRDGFKTRLDEEDPVHARRLVRHLHSLKG